MPASADPVGQGDLGIATNRADDVVEVVRNAAGHCPQRFHPPGQFQAMFQRPGFVFESPSLQCIEQGVERDVQLRQKFGRCRQATIAARGKWRQPQAQQCNRRRFGCCRRQSHCAPRTRSGLPNTSTVPLAWTTSTSLAATGPVAATAASMVRKASSCGSGQIRASAPTDTTPGGHSAASPTSPTASARPRYQRPAGGDR